ncbi:MAG: hypothetical protein NT069_03045 [Planctomycetota bacterium]|nr:hypothetical protein [Planctomycetota bacterium]
MTADRQRPSAIFIKSWRLCVAHGALRLLCLSALACGLTVYADTSRSSAHGEESPVESGASPDGKSALSNTARALVLEMTAIGLNPGPHQIPILLKPLKPLRRELGEDPRIDYLLGIAQLRHGKYKPAVTHLEEYLRKSSDSDPHTRQLLIWGKLVDRRYEAGFYELAEFARSLRRTSSTDDESDDLEMAAEWVGEIFAAMDALISTTDKPSRQRLESCEAQLRDSLEGNLEGSFEIGKGATRARLQALGWKGDSNRQSQNAAKGMPAPPRKGRSSKQKAPDPADLMENTKPTEEARPVVATALADVERRLVHLEHQFLSLKNRVQQQSQTSGVIGDELAITREAPVLVTDFGDLRSELPSKGPFGGNPASPFFENAADRADVVAQLEYRYYISRVDYNHLVERLAQTTREGVSVSGVRAELLEKTPRGAARATDSISGDYVWRTRLDAVPKPVALQPVTVKGKKGITTPRSLRDVMPLDIEGERRRIHRLFGVESWSLSPHETD